MNTKHKAHEAMGQSITRQVARLSTDSLSYTPDQIRLSSRRFGPQLSLLRHHMDTTSEWRARHSSEVANSLLQDVAAASDWHLTFMHAFQDAEAQLNACPRGVVVYSAASRDACIQLGRVVGELRCATADAVDPRDPRGQLLRTAIGVGEAIRYESPVEVERYARQQVEVLTDPDNAAYLMDLSVRADVFMPQLTVALSALSAALDVGGDRNVQELREKRDQAQLRLEVVTERALALVTAALGREKRDELRATAPSKRKAKQVKAQEDTQQAQGTTEKPKEPQTPPKEAVGNTSDRSGRAPAEEGPTMPFLSTKGTTAFMAAAPNANASTPLNGVGGNHQQTPRAGPMAG